MNETENAFGWLFECLSVILPFDVGIAFSTMYFNRGGNGGSGNGDGIHNSTIYINADTPKPIGVE